MSTTPMQCRGGWSLGCVRVLPGQIFVGTNMTCPLRHSHHQVQRCGQPPSGSRSNTSPEASVITAVGAVSRGKQSTWYVLVGLPHETDRSECVLACLPCCYGFTAIPRGRSAGSGSVQRWLTSSQKQSDSFRACVPVAQLPLPALCL